MSYTFEELLAFTDSPHFHVETKPNRAVIALGFNPLILKEEVETERFKGGQAAFTSLEETPGYSALRTSIEQSKISSLEEQLLYHRAQREYVRRAQGNLTIVHDGSSTAMIMLRNILPDVERAEKITAVNKLPKAQFIQQTRNVLGRDVHALSSSEYITVTEQADAQVLRANLKDMYAQRSSHGFTNGKYPDLPTEEELADVALTVLGGEELRVIRERASRVRAESVLALNEMRGHLAQRKLMGVWERFLPARISMYFEGRRVAKNHRAKEKELGMLMKQRKQITDRIQRERPEELSQQMQLLRAENRQVLKERQQIDVIISGLEKRLRSIIGEHFVGPQKEKVRGAGFDREH